MNIKKFLIFFKYIISAIISFLVDVSLFVLLSKMLSIVISEYAIIFATIIARIISSLVNYYLNKNKVFNCNNKNYKSTLIKYYSLVVIQMLVSAFSVWIINKITNIDATFIKIVIDGLIFVINYFVQKIFIFKKVSY